MPAEQLPFVRWRALAIGPFVGVSFAEYVVHSLDPAPPGATSAVDGRSVHEWFTLGIHGTYGPWRPR